MSSSSGVHPGELSRRISELDVTTLNRPSAEPEGGPRYTVDELNGLRPNQENHNGNGTLNRGALTPPEVPAPPPSPHNEASTSDGALADVDTNGTSLDADLAKKKKKKKSGKNKKPSPTGFEEFYADTPITPGEHEEEQDLYNPAIPFHERIQTCIQRYRKRRNLDSTKSHIFTKYLMLGGIEGSTTKPFTGGLDQDTLDNSTAQDIVAIQATDFIRSGHNNSKYYDPEKPEDWVVDFEGIAKGFFSSAALKHSSFTTEQSIKTLCGVIRNFLNYIMRHGVCPEYTADIMAARVICDLAEKELMAMECLRGKLPGPFNSTASHLYGNMFLCGYLGDSKIDTTEERFSRNEKLQAQAARWDRIIKTGVAFEGTLKMFDAVETGDVHLLKSTPKRYVEVVHIDRASPDMIKKYSVLEDHEGNVGNILPLGKVHIKAWEGPGHLTPDITEEEENTPASYVEPVIETLWIEDNILEHFFLGMKMEVETTELDIGLTFIEEVHGFFCSFYTVLPNEKMLDNWKEPVPNTRPPPTEDNPDAEEDTKDTEPN